MADRVLGFVIDPESSELLYLAKAPPGGVVGQWDGIAGKVEEGEQPEQAIARRALESMGLFIPCENWERCALLHTPEGKTHVFRAKGNIYAARGREHDRPVFYSSRANLQREPVKPHLQWLIPLLLAKDVKSIVEVAC